MTGFYSTSGRERKSGDARLASSVLIAILLLGMLACGGGGTNGPPSSHPTPDPLYQECISTNPVDAGNPAEPVIALVGARVISQPVGTTYADPGATAIDPTDGDISSRIQVTGLSQVDTNIVGDYLIRYNVSNSANLKAVEAVRIVRVNAGTFNPQTARDIGTTSAHMGYYEHLPVHYSDDPNQRFPLLIFQYGWFNARFLDPYTVQAPLSILEDNNLVKLIKRGDWDDSRPFIVLSPQKCVDAPTFGVTANRMKLFIDYAVNTYQVDTSRIYMAGHSQGSGDTWDYVTNYPQQLAAVVPMSGGYGTSSGCILKDTPAWAFNGELDTVVAYQNQAATVGSINACSPPQRARITVLPGIHHNDVQDAVFNLTGLNQGLPQYDPYDQNIYDWMLLYSRP